MTQEGRSKGTPAPALSREAISRGWASVVWLAFRIKPLLHTMSHLQHFPPAEGTSRLVNSNIKARTEAANDVSFDSFLPGCSPLRYTEP
jgi:hypothetical protein